MDGFPISGSVLRHAFPCPPEDEKIKRAIEVARKLAKTGEYDVIVVDEDTFITESNFCASTVFVYTFKIIEVDMEKVEHYDGIIGRGRAEMYRWNGELIKRVSGEIYISTDGDVRVKDEETEERIGALTKYCKWSYVSERIPKLFRERKRKEREE